MPNLTTVAAEPEPLEIATEVCVHTTVREANDRGYPASCPRTAIGIGQSPVVALSYLSVAAVLVACAKYAETEAKPAELDAHHGPLPAPAE